jgi:ubiquinone/menaquinone biosynthesis C-methylase UbiE
LLRIPISRLFIKIKDVIDVLLRYREVKDKRPENGIDLSTWYQYSGSSLNVNARAYVMDKYSRPGIDFAAETINSLRQAGMRPEDSVIDVGCSDGSWLIELVEKDGHTGTIFGVDDSINSLAIGEYSAKSKGIANLSFLRMDARSLDFPDDTFDTFSSQNLLYHVNKYEKAIAELVRVSKYGAVGVISTKGDQHLPRIWMANERIAPNLPPPYEGAPKPKMPANFYETFDASDAKGILQQYFEVIDELEVTQESVALIPPEGWLDYKQALLSLKDSYSPIPRGGDIEYLIDTEIKGIFDREVTHYGFYKDYVQRVAYICRNTKK